MKNRVAQNQIRRLNTLNGSIAQTEAKIVTEINNFYHKLPGSYASCLPSIQYNVMEEGNKLTRDQQLPLIAPVSRDEVFNPMRDIDDNKAPRCDGFNSCFFKKSWDNVREDITSAVIEFFDTDQIYKPINCTSVTLIPKVNNPSSVKEYMLISSCTILYKIISKVITKRL